MDFATIDWAKALIPFEDITAARQPALDETGFYSVLVARPVAGGGYDILRLAYIGVSFQETLRARIPRGHAEADCINGLRSSLPGSRLVVRAGELLSASLERPTEEFYQAVRRCLVMGNQPSCNRSAAAGDDLFDIQVENAGDFRPLKRASVYRRW